METSHIQNDLTNISEIQVIYKPKFKAAERPKISTSLEGYNVLKSLWNNDTVAFQEEFKILLLNRSNKVLGIYNVGVGGMHGVYVDIKLVFAIALKTWASSIILSHNHPSGNMKPSENDVKMTKKIAEIGTLLEISVLDHLIIGPGKEYYSFSDEGII